MLLTSEQVKEFFAKHPQTCPQCGAQAFWECDYEPELGPSANWEGGEAMPPHFPCVFPKCKRCGMCFSSVPYRLPE